MSKILYKITFLILLFTIESNSQTDFDKDSVYYSPIPKATAEKKENNTEKREKLLSYFFSINSGALVGCQDCNGGSEVTFSSSTIHGATIGKKLRVGVGLGYDSYYLWQTAPLFGTVSWDLIGNKNKNALFLQFGYGGANAWRNSVQEYGFKKVEGGKTFTTQIGYRIRYHDVRISFLIGTKYQEVTTFYEYPTYRYGFNGQPILGETPSTKSVLQELNRIQLSISIGWK
ncbi:MAG: hypothetical protein ACKVOQ_05550 [Cyclobacteriaceae bacterium]